jgi:metal-responsive CopG/Arc/MetJ family transcriptional regulator
MKKVRNRDKRITITVTLAPSLISEIEEQAKNEQRNRSNMISCAIREYLLNRGQVQA